MEFYFIVMVIVMIIAILALIFFTSYTKLKKYKEKMDKAENIIEENLNKKLDLIIAINGEVKKVTGKKDYLKEYVSIRDLIITNIEKDLKLDEAVKLINDLTRDFEELMKDEDMRAALESLFGGKGISTDNILSATADSYEWDNAIGYTANIAKANSYGVKISTFREWCERHKDDFVID